MSSLRSGNCKLGHDWRRVCSHRRHDATRQFRRVGVGGVYWTSSVPFYLAPNRFAELCKLIILTRLLAMCGRSLSKSRSRTCSCWCRLSSDDITAADWRSCWLQRLHSHSSFRHRSAAAATSFHHLHLSDTKSNQIKSNQIKFIKSRRTRWSLTPPNIIQIVCSINKWHNT